ncbi:PREDICTED: ELL-associated factor 2 [Nelumbo nucifera]|uniref:ELL-associated factor 2 n=1 Tax=Nelumbo nucifera TaxID=4432 RepID=A0A1U7Z841_NELNU|nr:PREDICTED: ELL-associated factor 2 [Nelumbo nucifera]
MANINNKDEPSNAPQPDRWYNLTLGSSFRDHSSTKFCTLRYDFKPASIDKTQPGSLHKNKENRVTVEFHNNQPGKPKVTFEGSSEVCKDNDGVLFFDGETFRLERLHRAVKRLRYLRQPGESAAAVSAAASVGPSVESRSPPLGKSTKSQPMNKNIAPPVQVEVERIDIGDSESPGTRPTGRTVADYPTAAPNPPSESPDLEEHLDIVIDDEDDGRTSNKGNAAEQMINTVLGINQNDTDDEIADVDVSDDEAEKGPNAAEALRAQVNAEERDEQTSSSSGSSESSSESGSGSGSSSSDSEASDEDSVNSI